MHLFYLQFRLVRFGAGAFYKVSDDTGDIYSLPQKKNDGALPWLEVFENPHASWEQISTERELIDLVGYHVLDMPLIPLFSIRFDWEWSERKGLLRTTWLTESSAYQSWQFTVVSHRAVDQLGLINQHESSRSAYGSGYLTRKEYFLGSYALLSQGSAPFRLFIQSFCNLDHSWDKCKPDEKICHLFTL